MSWVRIWVHVVFSTKNREPYLASKALRFKVFRHIKANANEKEIWLDCVNGYQEHAHCLIGLGKNQTISKIAQLIKGESSFWINRNKLTDHKFMWQDDYWAVSVSEGHLPLVRKYIHKQESYHKAQTFLEEMDGFTEKYRWEKIKE